MTKATYFLQVCPTCGRRLQVRIEYLGKVVACQHCHGRFEARDPETTGHHPSEVQGELIDRVDEILATADAWITSQSSLPGSSGRWGTMGGASGNFAR